MMFDNIISLLDHFGYQLVSQVQTPPSVAFCEIKEDCVLWYVPQSGSEKALEDYIAAPYFSSLPEKIDSTHTGNTCFKIDNRVMNYEHFMNLVGFLESGLIGAFVIGDKSYIYPKIITHEYFAKGDMPENSEADLARFVTEAEKNPQSALLQNYVGKLYFARGDFNMAATHFVAAFHLQPYYAEPFCNMGTILWSTGSKEKAFELFCEALVRNPFSQTVQDNFIKAGIDLGAVDLMLKELTNIEKFYPDFEDLSYLKSSLLEKAGLDAVSQAP